MAIYRSKRKKHYTLIDNQALQDAEMSYLARGLLVTMLSFPDNWKFYEKDLVKRSNKDGRDKVHKGIIELQELGYLKKIPKRDKQGRFCSPDWVVYDHPVTEIPSTENPETVKPDTEKPSTVNPQLSIIKLTNNLNNKRLNELSLSKSPSQKSSVDNFSQAENQSERDKKLNQVIYYFKSRFDEEHPEPEFNSIRLFTNLQPDEKRKLNNAIKSYSFEELKPEIEKAAFNANSYPIGYLIKCIERKRPEAPLTKFQETILRKSISRGGLSNGFKSGY